MAVRISRGRKTVKYAAAGLFALLAACGGESPTAPPTPAPTPAPGMPPVATVASEGWVHVPEGSAVTYAANPPASGPHYPVWGRYKEHTAVLARPYWVHDLEHGAIVLLYRPDAPASAVAELRQAYQALPNDPACGHKRALMTPDPQLPQPVAAVAALRVMMADRLDPSWVRAFTDSYRGQGPEAVCQDGSVG
jgi:uncharacterized protein DUF3105